MNHSDNIVELTIKQTRRQARKCKYSDGIKFVYGKNRYKYKFVNLRTGQVRKYQFDSTEMCRECHAEENKIMELLDKINNDNYFWSYITPALNSQGAFIKQLNKSNRFKVFKQRY